MKTFYGDMHIHIGRNHQSKRVKISGANNLTVENIVKEAAYRKGLDILGIVDCLSPHVQVEIEFLLEKGVLSTLPSGGLRYENKVTILLGVEVETEEENGGHMHCLGFFPFLEQIKSFTSKMKRYVRNVYLSTQKASMTADSFCLFCTDQGGDFFFAHAFTPFKSVYGNCTDRIEKIFSPRAIRAVKGVELGLSADSNLADRIEELACYPFLSNSDAHSLPKIGREYNEFLLENPTYEEVMKALANKDGRKIVANYGLDPELGKYHRTRCLDCGEVITLPPPVKQCPHCGGREVIFGVLDRIVEIQDYQEPHHPVWRPPYYHQIPLEFIPGIGAKTLAHLIKNVGTEMTILHKAHYPEIAEVVGEKIAKRIIAARTGEIGISTGGGGQYGKILTG